MATIINGKAIAEKVHIETARRVARLKKQGTTTKLAVVLVGNDPASEMYDRMKGAAAKKVGIEFLFYQFPASITKTALIQKIKQLQTDENPAGLIIQLPLPEKLYIPEVLDSIEPARDVDFLTDTSMGKLIMHTNDLLPPTPGAVMSVLETIGVKLAGKNITIIGMGALVGKPLAIMLINEGASVTTCNSRTKNIKDKCLTADIIVSGVGKRNIVRGNMVRPGAIVIDAGVSFYNKKVFGDINLEEVAAEASYITPTPGGIGPITVARLLHNTVIAAEQQNKLPKKRV